MLGSTRSHIQDGGNRPMTKSGFGRRDFLKGAVIGGAAAAAGTTAVATTSTAIAAAEIAPQQEAGPVPSAGYEVLSLDEARFGRGASPRRNCPPKRGRSGSERGLRVSQPGRSSFRRDACRSHDPCR